MTRYLVLRLDGTQWGLLTTVEASSSRAAIQAATKAKNDGTYVAVPERSWTPVKVTIRHDPVVKIAPLEGG